MLMTFFCLTALPPRLLICYYNVLTAVVDKDCAAVSPLTYSCFYRYAPSKRWHIDTIMRVLTTVRVEKHLLFCSFETAEFKYYYMTISVLPWAGRFAVALKRVVPLHRQEATCGTIPFPTSSSWSPTVWRCMPTQYRDCTKRCWTTSPRSEQRLLPIHDQFWHLALSCHRFHARTVIKVQCVFCVAATSRAGRILVYRRVWRPASVWPVWGGGTHSGISTIKSNKQRVRRVIKCYISVHVIISGDWRWSLGRAGRPLGV